LEIFQDYIENVWKFFKILENFVEIFKISQNFMKFFSKFC
jgi:hypothetical protein